MFFAFPLILLISAFNPSCSFVCDVQYTSPITKLVCCMPLPNDVFFIYLILINNYFPLLIIFPFRSVFYNVFVLVKDLER